MLGGVHVAANKERTMIDKITIPPADGVGECGNCPFMVQADDGSHCFVGVSADEEHVNCSPGPECIPGDYAVLPVDEFAALRADSERLGEIFHERINHPARIPMEESCCVGCVRYGVVFKLNEALEACKKACSLKLRTALAGKEMDPDGR
jgi:hypothetical protein